jgi:hypothetical protein
VSLSRSRTRDARTRGRIPPRLATRRARAVCAGPGCEPLMVRCECDGGRLRRAATVRKTVTDHGPAPGVARRRALYSPSPPSRVAPALPLAPRRPHTRFARKARSRYRGTYGSTRVVARPETRRATQIGVPHTRHTTRHWVKRPQPRIETGQCHSEPLRGALFSHTRAHSLNYPHAERTSHVH